MTTENIKVNARQGQVVNDIDNALAVIDPKTKTEIERIHLSEALIGPNAKPHDVILDPSGRYAYVTITQANNPTADLLLKISTQTFDVVESAEIGKEAITNDGERLFVTHSGADANAVSRYALDDPTLPVWESSVNTQGLNP